MSSLTDEVMAQCHRSEMLSPIQALTVTKQQQRPAAKRKSTCHGNRKLYHFKRKWRARGLDEQAIQALICSKQQSCHSHNNNNDDHQNESRNTVAGKRKIDQSASHSVTESMKSLSQLSISQQSSNKQLNEMTQQCSPMDEALCDMANVDLHLHKYSKYLKMPRRLLLQSLRLQLDYRLTKKISQNYVLCRLKLLDEHFCADRIRHLYQSYLDLGFQDQTWKVS